MGKFIKLFLAALVFQVTLPSHAQTDKATSPAIEVDIRPDQNEKAAPAKIVADARFQDASADSKLDAGEEGNLIISLSNQGGRRANNLAVSLRPESPAQGLRIGTENRALRTGSSTRVAQFSELRSGATENTSISLKGTSSLPNGDIQLVVQVETANGLELDRPEHVTIPVGQTSTVPVVDRDIPETKMKRPNDIAVVIGNTEYKNADIPNVDYAVRDAQTMKKYLTRTLGFRKENIIYVENASGSALSRIFGTDDSPKGQLHNWVKPSESSVFIYYSGHGAPNPETGNAYLIASNTNPNYLSQNGYPLSQLYENLAKVPAQSVTVALEACFSGTSEGGAVVQNASPAVLSVENPMVSMEQGLAFTAGATDQIASWYPEKKHGLFTYYFLNGLRGNADGNDDSAVTAKEMKSYLTNKVPYRARRMFNREQTPQVVGQNLDRVLVRYGDSAPAAQQKARLPVTTTDVEASVKNALSLPDGAKKVTSVDDTDALRQDDVITAADGSDLESAGRLAEIVEQHAPGDTLRLKILREGNSQTVSVTLTTSQ